MSIDQKSKTIVFVAFFVAITYVATSIQVPMPALIGKPFVHLGNAAALLSVLLLGYQRGAFAGGAGLALFDITHNYVLDAPYYFFEIFIVGGIAILVFNLTQYHVAPKPIKLVTIIAAAIVTKFVTTTLHNFIMSLVKGLTFQPAVIATLSALMPTVINCATTMLVVLITYPILNKQLRTKLRI